MVKDFLTFEDIVRDGACAEGVIEACIDAGNIFACTVDEALDKFDSPKRILRAAQADGYGYGYGYGSGYGSGSGYGDGDGYGDGYGYGYGDGYGDGDGGHVG